MAENKPNDHPKTTSTNEIEAIQADIARARDELTDTVVALAGKMNLKARANRAVRDAKTRVMHKAAAGGRWSCQQQAILFAVGAGIVVLITITVSKRRTQRMGKAP